MTKNLIFDKTTIDHKTIAAKLAELERAIGTRRKTLVRELVETGVKLQGVRADLEEKLNAGWDFLEAHPDDQREAIWIEWLHAYESCCDLQSRIAYHALGSASGMVTERREAA